MDDVPDRRIEIKSGGGHRVARVTGSDGGARLGEPGPAARWIAPSTPPPPNSDSFAAATMASTAHTATASRLVNRYRTPTPMARIGNDRQRLRQVALVGITQPDSSVSVGLWVGAQTPTNPPA
jgi:hypothetical protein